MCAAGIRAPDKFWWGQAPTPPTMSAGGHPLHPRQRFSASAGGHPLHPRLCRVAISEPVTGL